MGTQPKPPDLSLLPPPPVPPLPTLLTSSRKKENAESPARLMRRGSGIPVPVPPSVDHTTIGALADMAGSYEFVLHPGDLAYAGEFSFFSFLFLPCSAFRRFLLVRVRFEAKAGKKSAGKRRAGKRREKGNGKRLTSVRGFV